MALELGPRAQLQAVVASALGLQAQVHVALALVPLISKIGIGIYVCDILYGWSHRHK